MCDWLRIDPPLPAWTTVRLWLMRAGVAALEEPATATSIRGHFARVSVKQRRTWVATHLQTTRAAKRKIAYDEFTRAGRA